MLPHDQHPLNADFRSTLGKQSNWNQFIKMFGASVGMAFCEELILFARDTCYINTEIWCRTRSSSFFFICSLFSLLSVSIALARINHRIKFRQLKELPQ